MGNLNIGSNVVNFLRDLKNDAQNLTKQAPKAASKAFGRIFSAINDKSDRLKFNIEIKSIELKGKTTPMFRNLNESLGNIKENIKSRGETLKGNITSRGETLLSKCSNLPDLKSMKSTETVKAASQPIFHSATNNIRPQLNSHIETGFPGTNNNKKTAIKNLDQAIKNIDKIAPDLIDFTKGGGQINNVKLKDLHQIAGLHQLAGPGSEFKINVDAHTSKITINLSTSKHGFKDLGMGGFKHATISVELSLNVENKISEAELLVRGVNRTKDLSTDEANRLRNDIEKSLDLFEKLKGAPGLLIPKSIVNYTTSEGKEKIGLFTPYCDGGDLSKQQKNLSKENRLSIAMGLLNSVQGMHDKGIIHCDIKPENILLKKKGDNFEALLGDFDLAQSVDKIVRIGGTPGFMPPESKNSIIGKPSDVYATGITFLLLLNDKVNLKNNSKQIDMLNRVNSEAQERILNELPTPTQFQDAEWSQLKEIILQMIKAKPNERAQLATIIPLMNQFMSSNPPG